MKGAIVALAALGLVACDGLQETGVITPGGDDGRITVSFRQPAENLGGILLEVRGGEVSDPQATAEGSTLYTTVIPDGYRIAVVGEELEGRLLSFHVPDRALASSYRVDIIEMSDTRNHLLPDVSGYELFAH